MGMNVLLKEGGILTVDSRWDSGVHLGFTVNIIDPERYDGRTLDKVLTKDQIEALEMSLLVHAMNMLEGETVEGEGDA